MSEKSSGVSFANFVAVVGVVLFGVFSYFGQMFLSGGQLGVSLLWSVGLAVVAAALLVFMIRAKGTDKDFGLWRTVEYVTLVAYLVFAALTFRAPVLFMSLMINRSAVQQTGLADIDRIDDLYASYEDFEEKALTATGTGLLAVVGNQAKTVELKAFLAEKRIADNEASVASYCEAQRRLLLGEVYKGNKSNTQEQLAVYRNIIRGWSVFQMPHVDSKLAELGEEVAGELTESSARAALPLLDGGFIEKKNQKMAFDAPRTALSDKLKSGARSPLAWVGLVLIHLLILFNYVAAGRSDKPRRQRRKTESGFVLGDGFGGAEPEEAPAKAPAAASSYAPRPVPPPAAPQSAPQPVPPAVPVSPAMPPVPVPAAPAAVEPPVVPPPAVPVPPAMPPVPEHPAAPDPEGMPPVPPVPPAVPGDDAPVILG